MKSDKIKLRHIIAGLFTFLLTIQLAILLLLIGFGIGVFHDTTIIQKVNESNYYNEIHKEMNTIAEELMIEAGLPVTVLSEVITLDRVYISGKYYIEDTLAGRYATPTTTNIREKLSANMDQYLEEQGVLPSDELDSDVEHLLNEVEQVFQKGIQFEFVDYIASYKASYMHLLKIALPIVLCMIGVLCYFILRMNRYPHRGVRMIVYATIAASMMSILTASYLLLSGQYDKVEASPDYYRKFLVLLLQWDIKVFLYLGLMGLVIAIVLINLVGYMKNRISIK